MNTLLENPLPTIALGVVLTTLCGLVFLSRRSLSSLIALVAVVALTLLLLLAERLVVTPSEEVELAIHSLFTAVESNDTKRLLENLDPGAENLRSEAQTLMPLIDVEDTGATAIEIQVDGPSTATATCRGRLRGIHRKSGQQVMYFDKLQLQWVKLKDRWLLEAYTAYYQGKPLNAVNSLQSNRPRP